jgi:hypothetical protein
MGVARRSSSAAWREITWIGVLALGMALGVCGNATAAEFLVTIVGDGLGPDTLRGAIIAANENHQDDVIVLCVQGTFKLTRNTPNEDAARGGDLDIRETVEI